MRQGALRGRVGGGSIFSWFGTRYLILALDLWSWPPAREFSIGDCKQQVKAGRLW